MPTGLILALALAGAPPSDADQILVERQTFNTAHDAP